MLKLVCITPNTLNLLHMWIFTNIELLLFYCLKFFSFLMCPFHTRHYIWGEIYKDMQLLQFNTIILINLSIYLSRYLVKHHASDTGLAVQNKDFLPKEFTISWMWKTLNMWNYKEEIQWRGQCVIKTKFYLIQYS